MNTDQLTEPLRQRRRWPYIAAIPVALLAGIGIGSAVNSHTTIKTVAGPTVTKTVTVPGPATTVTKTVKVPGPTVYKTRYVPASQGPTGTTIASYSGQGNENTGSFNVPSSGDYYVKWSYSNNNGSNFAIQDTNTSSFEGDLPNDIASSGSGSTEDTGFSGSQSFNVMATGDWTITVVSAP